MEKYRYIEDFKKLGFGMFVHFGLYSMRGMGEWTYKIHLTDEKQKADYRALVKEFCVAPDWAKQLAETAKRAGCKYITLTTRHHDGFSLYDTCGLNTFDAPHSKCGRDLVREFVDACNENGIVPFFYHTLLDWWRPEYTSDFPAYIDYLIKSVEILCKNYGKIGGIWFDGWWDKKETPEVWQEDRLYAAIRKYQPQAIIVNNTGMGLRGKTGHKEIDCVTYERGKSAADVQTEKPLAGEMCEVLNAHWGYAQNDCKYKSVSELICTLMTCRRYNCNFLLNVGPMGNGLMKELDRGMFTEIGKWIALNGDFIYNVRGTDIEFAGDNYVVKDDEYYYAVYCDLNMVADANVALNGKKAQNGAFRLNRKVKSVRWLDNGEELAFTQDENGDVTIKPTPFRYGCSMPLRIAKIAF